VKLLGAEAVVIATGDTTITNNSYLGFGDLPDMGETGELNIEAIIGLNPDAVLVHTNRATEVLEEKLNPLGVKVIRIDNYQPERYDQEMRLLGKILDKEERAEEFLAYRVSVEKLVADQVQNIPEEERKTVMALSVGFINSNGGYRIFPCMANNGEAGVGEGYSTILAGGLDASPGTVWDPAQDNTTIHVEEEYALSCNPQVITLHGTWLGGYNATEPEAFTTVLDNIYNISSIGKMTAGENRDVYIFHTDMLGANKRHIGLLQLGKYLYPSRFGGIDAEAYAKEYFQDWLGTTYEGIWFYSAKDGQ
jgi:iron complex transport system substrate-binding protein